MRYVVRIAKLSESSNFWTQIALLGIPWSMLLWESIPIKLKHVEGNTDRSSSQQSVALLASDYLSSLCVWKTGSTWLCYLRHPLLALCHLVGWLQTASKKHRWLFTQLPISDCGLRVSIDVITWRMIWKMWRGKSLLADEWRRSQVSFDSDLKWSKATRWI